VLVIWDFNVLHNILNQMQLVYNLLYRFPPFSIHLSLTENDKSFIRIHFGLIIQTQMVFCSDIV